MCRAGEVVAFCTIGLQNKPERRGQAHPFPEETYDLQLTFAPSRAGVLHIRPSASLGGYMDQLHSFARWDADEVEAELEIPAGSGDAPHWLLGGAAGRRVTNLAEDRSGLLTGWHNRARAWHAESSGHLSLLSLGICEQTGIFRGERNGFFELLADAPAPLHAIYIGDEMLVPCALTLTEQLARSDADNAGIAADMTRGLVDTSMPITPADLLFMGGAMAALTRRPMADRFNLLTRSGLQSGGVDAAVLSVHSEPGTLLRHKRLGYHAYWHRFRVMNAGPAVREWLQVAFEPVKRSINDKARDLIALRKAAGAVGVQHLLVLNAMSSSGLEDIVSYQPFQGRLGDQIGTISAKETNLMLHDLADSADISLIDADAIAAAMGGRAHLPDGVHQSGPMQSELRHEILHVLHQRGAFSS